jgi:CRISPR/Cas system CSM-associated protein Csm3 (group 7 of RAMP superfamily)
MARTVTGRVVVTGELVARTALHVGGMGEDVTSDMPLARDGAGRFVVPGTSLAGAFRAWCERAFPESPATVTAIWGSADEDGAASRVCIEDIPVGDAESVPVDIRDGVGIDREWGTAAYAIKYDRAVLPRGTRLPLRLTIEHDEGSAESASEMAAALVAALADGEICLGAARTRGLGRVRLEGGRVERFDLGSRDGTLALLRRLAWEARGGRDATAAGRPAASTEIEPRHAPHAPPRLSVEIHWHPVGPLMVKAGADGVAVDTLPLLAGCEGGLSTLLPGSSIKGVLRGQAERIIRTLLDLSLADSSRPLERFLVQLRDIPLVDVMFGAAGESTRGGDDDAPSSVGDGKGPLPGLGALSVEDCHGAGRVSRESWSRVLAAPIEPPKGRKESPLREALNEAGLHDWTAAFHVAVDRWTGGAADQLLFTVMEPHGVEWEPIRLDLDFSRLPEPDHRAAVMLLLLLVRDLADGRLPLGYGVNRGLGSIAVDTVRVSGRGLPADVAPLARIDLECGDIVHLPAGLRASLDDAWQSWLAASAPEASS